MSEKLEDKLIELTNKLENVLTQFGPEVADAALGAVQVSGASNLVSGLTFYAVAYVVYRIGGHVSGKMQDKIKHFEATKRREYDIKEVETESQIASVISWLIAGIVCIPGTIFFSNLWSWVSMFNPKLALAHKILGL